MTSNQQHSKLMNINYLEKLIKQDPESLSDLLSQQELTQLLKLDKDNQDKILTLEVQRSNSLENDYLQFSVNRKQMWLELINENQQMAFDMIKPIILDLIKDNDNKNFDLFILTETLH